LYRSVIFGAVLAGASISSAAAQFAIDDIKVQLFKERAGALSENIANAGRSFVNTTAGTGDVGDPADAMLVTLAFTGPRNSKASDKMARDIASVTVTQMAKTGPRIMLKRAYGGFHFGADGRGHKAFWLDGATCAPLEIEVRLGRSRKTAKLDFRCDG
jgi:hypothetical protein